MSSSTVHVGSNTAAQMELTALEENRQEEHTANNGYLEEPRVYRKYESSVNSPESLRNGMCHPEVKRQESIMRHVFVRMQEKDLNSVADNLAPKYMDISSKSGSRRRVLRLDTLEETIDTMKPLPRYKTMGLDMEFSLRMTMSLAFSLLMGFGLLIMIIISSQFTAAILRNYDRAFDESLAQLVQGTAFIVNNNAESFGKTIVREFAQSVDEGLIILPVHAVADAWLYYLSIPDRSETFAGDLFSNGLLSFIFLQMQYFFKPIPNFYFAFDTNDVYGYKFPRRLIQGATTIENQYFLYAEGEDSDSNEPFSAQLYTCPVHDESGNSALSNCSESQSGVPYNTTQRPFFVIQSDRANSAPASPSVYLISDLYAYATSSEGYTITWPINTCGDYSCFEGVIAADVTTISASELCNESLYNALFELTGIRDPSNITEAAAFYVLVRENVDGDESTEGNQSGWLVGAAINNATLNGVLPRDDISQQANDPRFPLIAHSSRYLVESVGPFASDDYNTPQFVSFNGNTLQNCTCVEYSRTKLSKDSLECYTVSTYPAGEYSGSQDMLLASNVSWLAVAVLPCALFLQNLNTTITNVQNTIALQEASSKDAQSQQLITAIVIALILLLAVIVLAFLLASWISRSLVNVKKAMQSLRRFEFKKNAIRRYSRIREVAEIQETFLALRRALYAFAKFVPSTVVKNIVEGGPNSSNLHVQNKQVTILFSDIAGFTGIAEKLEVNDLLYLLTSYLTVMTRIVENYEGVVAEILGDGLLVYWNTPDDVKDHAAKGLATALACQQTIKTSFNSTFNELLSRYELDPIKVRIGVHTGVVLTGNMGSDKKMKFGCMGDPVNLASRLEGLCKLYGVEVLCSEETMKNLPTRDTFYVRELDLVCVQGKSKPTRIYEVISQDSAVHNVFEREINSKKGTAQSKGNLSAGGPPLGSSKADMFGKTSSASAPKRGLWTMANRKRRKSSTTKMKDSSTRTEMVFQVQDAKVNSSFRLNVSKYVTALRAFQSGDFTRAKLVINQVENPDHACKYLLERIEKELAREDHEQREKPWTGINKLYGKNF